MSRLRRWIGQALAFVLARRWFQPAARGLYRLALIGLNIGTGDHVATSGEQFALRRASQLLHAQPQRVVFDVGANLGAFTRAALEAFGPATRVLAFEPSPQTFGLLTAALAGHAGVEPHNLGLGEQPGRLNLYSDGVGSGMASLYQRDLQAQGRVLDQVEQVEVTTLDRFCAEHQITAIDYLKLDVEGHELSVLRGARGLLEAEAIRLIQFEFGGCAIDARVFYRDLYQLLNSRFRLYRMLRDGLVFLPQYSERDEVFVTTNFLAVSRQWPQL